MKPQLYIELDGPLVIPADEKADPLLNGMLAPYAKPFMHWAAQHFDVVCLTDRDMRRAHHALRELDLINIPVRGYLDAKTELMNPKSNFHWVDSLLTPTEVNWIAEHAAMHRVQTVDPEHGVTEATKQHLEQNMKKEH